MLLFLVLILPILYIVFECYAVKRHYDEVLSLETKPLVKVVIDHELMRWWKSGKSNISSGLGNYFLVDNKNLQLQSENFIAVPNAAPAFCNYFSLNYLANFTGLIKFLHSIDRLENNKYLQHFSVVSKDDALELAIVMGDCNFA